MTMFLLFLVLSLLGLPSLHPVVFLVDGFSTTTARVRISSPTKKNNGIKRSDRDLTTTMYATTTSTSSSSSSDMSTVETNDLDSSKQQQQRPIIASIVFLLPSNGLADTKQTKFGIHSPVDPPTLREAADHLSKKAYWFSDGQVETSMVVISEEDESTAKILVDATILIALGVSSPQDLNYAQSIFEQRFLQSDRNSKCQFALDPVSEKLPTFVGPYDTQSFHPSLVFPWTSTSSGKRFQEQMSGLFDRWTSDDFTVALMLFLNRFSGHSINWVKDSADATWEKGPIRNVQEFYGMATKCGDCLAECLQDDTCKACLEKLTELDTRDQAASYRTIVSYESEALEKFSFCTFQKHNIFQCQSTIPTIPKVLPITTWRNQPLTEDTARSLLIGHLDDDKAPEGSLKLPVSWKVACGANVAYDQFPSQNQLFYEAAKGKDMWYDPVFRVETLDGRHVWCKRHYRVRNGPVPGTFRLSVLDNGVTSNEFWTIIGAADDLSWVAFHYAGAATSVGQRYLGGLLCTSDGNIPDKSKLNDVWACFEKAGIQPWELFCVNNDDAAPGAISAGLPPLDYYRKDVLAMKQKLKEEQ